MRKKQLWGDDMFGLLIKLLTENLLPFALHFESAGKFPKPLSAKEERECFERMAAGDSKARDKLISHNLRLVAHIVKKYTPNGSDDADDLISIGTIGLIKAVGTFDYSKGCRFATYGARCVSNEILMHFRATKKLAAEVSIDESVDVDKNGNCLTLIDILADDSMPVDEKVGLETAIRTMLGKVETVLDEREREVIRMRYGLDGKAPLPQRETAEHLGISRSYVSRIEKRALEKLRSELGEGLFGL
ncbi:RNA polymerase sporulation sigma factor SigK [Ruminococcus sp. YE71]|uniref:RNA polymerase sporulation sigma factor SigK n=2 Tax=unclassified Ruminococcus TaxID=2608920 RepID=UPI0009313FC9|nr:RNA polymerase sporulation sigma factor SigK [Ruminococcus sp. YE71]